jgi:prepilin-type N-terminal cleavage/methylation domain-containing protein
LKEFPSFPNLRDPRGFSARVAQKNGFTLVELLVSTLILVIVATGWFTIMNATSPYREAQRRAAIEVAAGVLDTFFPDPNPENDETKTYKKLGYYKLSESATEYPFVHSDASLNKFPVRLFPSDSPIRYRLRYICAVDNEELCTIAANQLPQSDPRKPMWESLCNEIYKGFREDAGNVLVARISLYDSEKSETPFVEFEQLVGIAPTFDDDQPQFAGYK